MFLAKRSAAFTPNAKPAFRPTRNTNKVSTKTRVEIFVLLRNILRHANEIVPTAGGWRPQPSEDGPMVAGRVDLVLTHVQYGFLVYLMSNV